MNKNLSESLEIHPQIIIRLKSYILKILEVSFTKSGTYPILGDGTGAEVQITANTSGEIVRTRVINGGSGYTFGIVDLKSPSGIDVNKRAKLVPIIPPSKGMDITYIQNLVLIKY